MGKTAIVKARSRQGAKSLDLTIPVHVCRENEISDGDVFSVKVENQGEDIKIIYQRIFKQIK